uniref:Uncharacterized protein n=1 Tax=Arundo donax TaxID=35708 RepID=A0A0A9TFB7_ARUDO
MLFLLFYHVHLCVPLCMFEGSLCFSCGFLEFPYYVGHVTSFQEVEVV